MACRLIAAIIMLQTLFFKFTGVEESVYIFTQVGVEPWGRYLTGSAELVAGVLLFIHPLVVYGAIISLGVMASAILTHVTLLGIEIMGDGGQLFFMAIITFLCAAYLIWQRKELVF